MLVLTVNLRQGGNVRVMPALVHRILKESADILVFTEFRANGAAIRLLDLLKEAGYSHTLFNTDMIENSVLIASRSPMEPFDVVNSESTLLRQAFLGIRQNGVEIVGVYISQGDDKPALFAALLDYARNCATRGARALLIGDYNTGRVDEDVQAHPVTKLKGWFACEAEFRTLETVFVDAWRHLHKDEREYSRIVTLYKHKDKTRGWRVDHAFVSPDLLPDIREAVYRHDIRESNLSDHSPLLVRLQ